MFASSPRPGSASARRTSIAVMFAAWALGTAPCLAASADKLEIRHIGKLDGVLARRLRSQVRFTRLDELHASPIALDGATMDGLNDKQSAEIVATYRAGYSIVLFDANLRQIAALHSLVGEGVSYSSKDTGAVMAYYLRRANFIPTATLLTKVDPSPLKTPSGDPDARGVKDEEVAFGLAVERTVGELKHAPSPGTPGPARDPNSEVDWLSAPIQVTTFAINSPQGIYNTGVNVYALYRCIDATDHYAITASADWTASSAIWQGATSAGENPTMTTDNNGNLVIDWQDNRTYCSSPGVDAGFDDICRYANYPLSYDLTMIPRTEVPVVQLDAAPAATQGQQTMYASGFSFSIGGVVNVNAMGPGGGISLGATWTNTVTTSVPPLIVDVSNTVNEGVDWKFKYCTTGLEPDPGTNCTSHVQMVKDVCQAQLGDDASGTNPQLGQTPTGKFSDAVQSAHWQTDSAMRQGSVFDIEVAFDASVGTTVAHLGDGLNDGPDPIAGCNYYGCACVSTTQIDHVTKSFTFQIPYPSTKCSQ